MVKSKKTKSKKPKKKRMFKVVGPMPYLIAIGLIAVIILLVASAYLPYNASDGGACYTNADCGWKITNCCPETAGAHWECVNLREFKGPDCPLNVLCPQVISPKPSFECVCEEIRCVVR